MLSNFFVTHVSKQQDIAHIMFPIFCVIKFSFWLATQTSLRLLAEGTLDRWILIQIVAITTHSSLFQLINLHLLIFAAFFSNSLSGMIVFQGLLA